MPDEDVKPPEQPKEESETVDADGYYGDDLETNSEDLDLSFLDEKSEGEDLTKK